MRTRKRDEISGAPGFLISQATFISFFPSSQFGPFYQIVFVSSSWLAISLFSLFTDQFTIVFISDDRAICGEAVIWSEITTKNGRLSFCSKIQCGPSFKPLSIRICFCSKMDTYLLMDRARTSKIKTMHAEKNPKQKEDANPQNRGFSTIFYDILQPFPWSISFPIMP